MERQLLAMRHSALSKEGAEEAVESIDRVLHLLMEEQAKKQLTWGDVWAKTWADTKEVYLTVRRGALSAEQCHPCCGELPLSAFSHGVLATLSHPRMAMAEL